MVRPVTGGTISDRMFPSPITDWIYKKRGWFVDANFMRACVWLAGSVEDKVLVEMPLTSS